MKRVGCLIGFCCVWACAQQAVRPSSDTAATSTESADTAPKRRWVRTRADAEQVAGAAGTAIGTVLGEAVKGCTLITNLP